MNLLKKSARWAALGTLVLAVTGCCVLPFGGGGHRGHYGGGASAGKHQGGHPGR